MSIEQEQKAALEALLEYAKRGGLTTSSFETLDTICHALRTALRWEFLEMVERARVANLLSVAQRLRRDRGNCGHFS